MPGDRRRVDCCLILCFDSEFNLTRKRRGTGISGISAIAYTDIAGFLVHSSPMLISSSLKRLHSTVSYLPPIPTSEKNQWRSRRRSRHCALPSMSLNIARLVLPDSALKILLKSPYTGGSCGQ